MENILCYFKLLSKIGQLNSNFRKLYLVGLIYPTFNWWEYLFNKLNYLLRIFGESGKTKPNISTSNKELKDSRPVHGVKLIPYHLLNFQIIYVLFTTI